MLRRLLLLLLSLGACSAAAQTPEEKGLAIATAAERRDDGFGDFTANMEMILKNRHAEESRRKLRVLEREVPADGDKGLTLFDEPADVKGTALLTFSHKVNDDDQWLYLPALKRVKRISSANKSGSFMGSEFSYEDIGSQEIDKYRYKYLRDEPCDGKPCFVIERYPVSPNSGYTRQVVWLDQAHYRTWKVEYYDRKQSLLKTLTFNGYQQYLGKHWRAAELFMQNHQSGKSTLLKWSDYKFRVGLKDADFNEASLKRQR
ncbi:MAG: outer membrane lipoprotein-sorting protein [Gammaproteobacteria bacterium]|nr:outer membrane lipoprotein-sorting protein [Gammaproteobacteria bacterium]